MCTLPYEMISLIYSSMYQIGIVRLPHQLLKCNEDKKFSN